MEKPPTQGVTDMSMKDLLDDIGLQSKPENGQLVIDCPACGKPKHCYVEPGAGLYHCKVCGEKGNPYQMVRLCKQSLSPAEAMAIIERHGLADATKHETKTKDLSWLKDKIRKPSEEEVMRLCKSKGLTMKSLQSLSLHIFKDRPIMLLGGAIPSKPKLSGFLRVHLDGELILTTSGDKKYPILGKWGLLNLKAAEKANTIVFAEGWRDMLAAMDAGYVAIANTGGTGWQDA